MIATGMTRPDLLAPVRPSIAKPAPWRYSAPVTVNPVADLGRSNSKRRTSAPKTIAGAFFAPAVLRHGGCAWDTFGCAGFRLGRSANPRTAVTISCLAAGGDGSTPNGAVPMKHDPALNPSALRERAAAHRAMAIAALRSDSSLANRLRRYNHHMTICRDLEATAERLGATSTRDPRTALSWHQSSKSVRIDALNLRDHLRHARALADARRAALAGLSATASPDTAEG